MKKEHELILSGVLLNKNEEEFEKIDSLMEEKLNWAEIGGILLNHRLGGYFFLGLNEKQQKRIPKELREALKLLIKAQKSQQLEIIKELMPVNDALVNAGVRFAALKGAFFSSDMYEIGARRSNDLDLLVYEEDLDKLDVCLRKLGYIQSNMKDGKMEEATKKEKLIQRMNYHDLVPYVKETAIGVLDLDINFLFDNKDNPIDKTVYELGTKLYNGRNYAVTGLNYYTNLAHLCAHFYREATNTIWTEGRRDVTLYKVVDMINYIRFYGEHINIDEFIQTLDKLNMRDKAYYTFTILQEFYSVDFIDSCKKMLENDSFDRDFMNHIYDHKQKKNIVRNESFYDAAFSCIE